MQSIKKNKLSFTVYWTIIKISRSNVVTRVLIDLLAYLYYKIFRTDRYFKFIGKKYRYFYHLYNRTVAGERIVEIPISKSYIDKYKGKNILEVGNVLSHYFKVEHDILDKYEKGKDIINEDVVNYTSNKKYDLIISISTMEHVGHSYGEKKDLKKFSKGIKNLKKLLANNGKLLITLPVYYNSYVTNLIIKKKMPFKKGYFMKRYSFWNEWKQVDYRQAVSGNKYDGFYANSNVIYIGEYNK